LQAQSDIGEGFVISEGNRIVYANEAYQKMIGYDLEELQGFDSFFDLVSTDSRSQAKERFHKRLSGEKVHEPNEIVLLHKNGNKVYVDISVNMFRTDRRLRAVSILRDITERKKAEAEAMHHTYHDPITGFPNHMLFQEQFILELA